MPKSPRETAIVYAETRLEPWGKWSRDSANSLGLPRVSIIHKIIRRKLVRGISRNKSKVTAKGKETLSFRPRTIGLAPEAVAEVDKAVALLAENLQVILKVEYIEYRNAPMEDRCLAAGLSKKGSSRYKQLLESAKYSVFAALSVEEA